LDKEDDKDNGGRRVLLLVCFGTIIAGPACGLTQESDNRLLLPFMLGVGILGTTVAEDLRILVVVRVRVVRRYGWEPSEQLLRDRLFFLL